MGSITEGFSKLGEGLGKRSFRNNKEKNPLGLDKKDFTERQKLRFKDELKREGEGIERERVKKETSDKVIIGIDGGAYDNTGIARDQLKRLARSGMDESELRNHAIQRLESGNRTDEQDGIKVREFLRNSQEAAATQQMTLTAPADVTAALTRLGGASKDDAAAIISGRVTPDLPSLMRSTPSGRAGLVAKQAQARETREVSEEIKTDAVRDKLLGKMRRLTEASIEGLQASKRALFAKGGVQLEPRKIGFDFIGDLLKAKFGHAGKAAQKFGGQVSDALKEGPEALSELFKGGRKASIEQIKIIKLISEQTNDPLSTDEIMDLIEVGKDNLRKSKGGVTIF